MASNNYLHEMELSRADIANWTCTTYIAASLYGTCRHNWWDKNYHIAGYFRWVFIFKYSKRPFSVKTNFQVQLLFKNIFSWLNKMHSRDYIIFAAWMRFVALSSSCSIQKARNLKHCPQFLIRPLIKLCMLAAHHFETTEGAL